MRFGEHVQGICEEVFANARPSGRYGIPFVSFRGHILVGSCVLLRVTTARRLGLRVGIGISVDPKTTNFQGSTQHRVLEHVSIWLKEGGAGVSVEVAIRYKVS